MAKSESPSNSIIDQVKNLLNDNRPDEAIKILSRNRDTSTAIQNARAACLMRLGQAEDALRILNSLIFPHGGVSINPDAPLRVKVNYATALLLSGNLAGCLAALGELRGETHPSVERLRQAIASWRKSQDFWCRFSMAIGMHPFNVKVPLDFPPGEM